MKTNFWRIPTAMLMTGLLIAPTRADEQPKPEAPAPATPSSPQPATPKADVAPAANKSAPKKSTATQSAAKKPDAASQLRSVPLVPGPATVIASNVNVRGQAKLRSEIVTKLTRGDTVTVIEEVVNKKSAADEPSAWAKIVFPAKAHVWINATFVDANKAVKPKKLNVRTGPGENYSVAGTMARGDAVKEVSVKEGWMQIEAPAGAYAFMAAAYLEQAPAAPAQPIAAIEPPPTTANVPEATPVAPPPTGAPTTPEATTTAPAPVPAPEPSDEPPPKRIVQREGIVRGTASIQAPTRYGLVSLDTGKMINYLYTTSAFLDLNRYKGLHIIVTGEEGLDERWKNTPVITIQKIQVLE